MKTVMTCRWDNTNFNMKHIPSGYQVNFSHDLQTERNEQLTSQSYQLYAGWGKMSLFWHHIMINTTLNCSISKWKKKWYTAEIHESRKCTLKDHFFETFLILCRIKNKTYFSQQLTTLYKPKWWWMWYIVLKIKTNFESTLKKQSIKESLNPKYLTDMDICKAFALC